MNRRIIVQKYGGSSLATAEKRRHVARRIIGAADAGFSVVVVVSAIGRYPDPYATDTLIRMLESQYPSAEGKEKDLMMSCGEIVSSVVMAGIVRSMGRKCVALTGAGAGIMTDGRFGDAQILTIRRKRIRRLLENDAIVIVAGFQGVTEDLEITTLGRGGSDTTATALGAALDAEGVEIYTDVEGVMTADPRIYDRARIIRDLSCQEMGEMASEGAKVLHSRCVALSSDHGVPLWVRSSFTDDRGSFISSAVPAGRRAGLVTGLIHKSDVVEFILDLSSYGDSCTIRRSAFEDLAAQGISLDLINVCYDRLYFITMQQHKVRVAAYLEGRGIPFSQIEGLAKISSVGMGMKGTPGVMARICEVLISAGIHIYRSVDSFINISCLIEERHLYRAMEVLHDKFGLGEEEAKQEMDAVKGNSC